jgi:hypothetical protein
MSDSKRQVTSLVRIARVGFVPLLSFLVGQGCGGGSLKSGAAGSAGSTGGSTQMSGTAGTGAGTDATTPMEDAGTDQSSSAGSSGTAGVGGTVGTAGAAGAAGATGGSGAAGAGVDGGSKPEVGCPSTPPAPPTGTTINLSAPATLASALATAKAGDRIVMHAGTYAQEQASNRKFASMVFVEAAAGETVKIAGARFQSCDHLAFRDIKFTATVMLDGSSNFTFHGVTLDGGMTEEAALQIHGQSSAGASHDVLVEDSTISGGGRTIFVLGSFAPSDKWNHHLTFVRDDITCGSHNCFQISGGRDMLIDGNKINGTTTSGVLTAGATRITITRNRFVGMSGKSPEATQIASPGMEWDNYAGVENMISSAIVIANNVIDGWGAAVQLDAARDVAIVYNTVADGTGVRFNHRTPHDQAGNVILNGNSNIRVWNNILPSLSISTGETRPTFESNNVVWKGGGGGTALVTMAPVFTGTDFQLAAGSPGVDAALINAETPLVDFENRPRGDKPDVGARELGAGAPAACP